MSNTAQSARPTRGRQASAAPETSPASTVADHAETADQDAARNGGSAPEAMSRINELRVSGHMMTLDPGLFCLFHTQSSVPDGSGLPGVRISLPPGPGSRPDLVTISTFRDDGWLAGGDDAALVRVAGGQAQILVTIYQSPAHGLDQAPRLQVVKLSGDEPANAPVPAQGSAGATRAGGPPPEVVAHVQREGDVGGVLGEWLGVRGSQRWVEGFGLAPREMIQPNEIEYQAVLGRGWLSPWVEGGKFCGSRGMALPLLGLRVRLRGAAAEKFDLMYSATFIDGTAIGPVGADEPCEADSLAALEAFQIVVTPKNAAGKPRVTAPASRAKPAPAAPAPAPKRGR